MYHTTYQTILNPLTHHYNTRREAVQQRNIVHAFAQHTVYHFTQLGSLFVFKSK